MQEGEPSCSFITRMKFSLHCTSCAEIPDLNCPNGEDGIKPETEALVKAIVHTSIERRTAFTIQTRPVALLDIAHTCEDEPDYHMIESMINSHA